ncbi:MAG: SRPBCC family protein [Nakamurella sp.]
MSLRLLYRGPALTALHEEYAKHGRTDEQAQIAATGSVYVDAPPRRVWETLSAVANWPAVDPAISDVQLPAGVAVDAPFTWVSGRARITSRFAVVNIDHELTWTGVSFGARAVHRHLLHATPGGGTWLESAESMTGPLLTLFYSSARLDKDLTGWLGAIKTAAEHR